MLKHLAPEDLEPSDLEKAHEEIRILTTELHRLREQHGRLARRYLVNRLVFDKIVHLATTLEQAQQSAQAAWHGSAALEQDENTWMEGYPG